MEVSLKRVKEVKSELVIFIDDIACVVKDELVMVCVRSRVQSEWQTPLPPPPGAWRFVKLYPAHPPPSMV